MFVICLKYFNGVTICDFLKFIFNFYKICVLYLLPLPLLSLLPFSYPAPIQYYCYPTPNLVV